MNFLKANPEKVMIFIFPIVILALFIAVALGWWLIQTLLQTAPGF